MHSKCWLLVGYYYYSINLTYLEIFLLELNTQFLCVYECVWYVYVCRLKLTLNYA